MGDHGKKMGDIRAEVTVVGGGMAGLTLALALASAGLEVCVIERDDPTAWADQAFDGRVSAISAGSRRVFETLDL